MSLRFHYTHAIYIPWVLDPLFPLWFSISCFGKKGNTDWNVFEQLRCTVLKPIGKQKDRLTSKKQCYHIYMWKWITAVKVPKHANIHSKMKALWSSENFALFQSFFFLFRFETGEIELFNLMEAQKSIVLQNLSDVLHAFTPSQSMWHILSLANITNTYKRK